MEYSFNHGGLRTCRGRGCAAIKGGGESSHGRRTYVLQRCDRGCYGVIHGNDELVITGEHEANVGPWKNLAAVHHPPLTIHRWEPIAKSSLNPYELSYNGAFSTLSTLLNPRTRLVALSGCSNILGELLDFKEAVRIVRSRAPNAWIALDLVAYAPHRSLDAQAWDVDFAVFSFYKLYGPHTAVLYARSSVLKAVSSIAHHFHSPRYDSSPVKLQPGGPGYELTYSATAVLPYLTGLSTADVVTTVESQRSALEHTSKLFEAHERVLCEMLLKFLTSLRARARGVRVVGPEEASPTRVPTVSFLVLNGDRGEPSLRSRDIVERVDALGTIAIRFGHFYAYGLVQMLPGFGGTGCRSVDDGIVRISLVHYNTIDEVERIVNALEGILFK